jgi:hypothetical protein
MTAIILDGHIHAQILIDNVANELDRMPNAPGLAVVLVGDDPASHIYVQSKIRMAERLGLRGGVELLPHDASESALLALIGRLNARDARAIAAAGAYRRPARHGRGRSVQGRRWSARPERRSPVPR